ncbi:MAG: outer membrane protein [Rhizobiaceae bacterium]
MTSSSLKLTSLAACLVIASQITGFTQVDGKAHAADMLADEVYDYTPVEFGTGWYLRGDIGAGLSSVTVESNFHYGEADLGNPISFTLGAGYTYAEGLRTEFAFNHFNNLAFSSQSITTCGTEVLGGGPIPVAGNCFASANASINTSTVMANLYADLGTYWGIRPYVGAGLGVAYVSWRNFSFSKYCEGVVPGDCGLGGGPGLNTIAQGTYSSTNSWTYAANAMLGVSYELTRDLTLDMGYRYTYVGEAGVARAASNAGNFSDFTVGDTGMHELRFGLRYEIW